MRTIAGQSLSNQRTLPAFVVMVYNTDDYPAAGRTSWQITIDFFPSVPPSSDLWISCYTTARPSLSSTSRTHHPSSTIPEPSMASPQSTTVKTSFMAFHSPRSSPHVVANAIPIAFLLGGNDSGDQTSTQLLVNLMYAMVIY